MSSRFADISSNNGSFNAGAYKSSGEAPCAIMLKATEHDNYFNPFYLRWLTDAHAHGLPVFHYHFCRPEAGNPVGQARWFWQHIEHGFHRPGDFVVADLETGSPRGGAAWFREFDAELTRISHTHPWCYTFLSYFMEGEVVARSKRMHIAAWGSHRPGNVRWGLPFGMGLAAWQFTDGVHGPTPHAMPGIPGTCDVSVLNPSIQRELHAANKHRRKHK